MTTKGILLIAGGHPYYGKMAAALAAMFKAAGTTLKIHLAWGGDALTQMTEPEKSLFSGISEIPAELYEGRRGNPWIRSKLCMFYLSPFQETIYLDTDLAWFPMCSPDALFEEVIKDGKKPAATFSSYPFDRTIWATHADIVSVYGEADYPNIWSEIIYFRQIKKARDWFGKALDVYDSLEIKSQFWAGGIPDELPLSIAAGLTGVQPHIKNWRPFYNFGTEKLRRHIYQLAENFKGLSMAGNQTSTFEIDTYNTLSAAAYHKLGLQNPYKWKAKNSFLPERINL